MKNITVKLIDFSFTVNSKGWRVHLRQILESWWVSLFLWMVCFIVYWYCKEILGFDGRVIAHLFTIPAFFLITLATFSSFFLLFAFWLVLVRPASEKTGLKLWFQNLRQKVFWNVKCSQTRAASVTCTEGVVYGGVASSPRHRQTLLDAPHSSPLQTGPQIRYPVGVVDGGGV